MVFTVSQGFGVVHTVWRLGRSAVVSSPTRSAAAMERSRERGSLRGASEKVFAVEEFVGCDFHRVAGLGALLRLVRWTHPRSAAP